MLTNKFMVKELVDVLKSEINDYQHMSSVDDTFYFEIICLTEIMTKVKYSIELTIAESMVVTLTLNNLILDASQIDDDRLRWTMILQEMRG